MQPKIYYVFVLSCVNKNMRDEKLSLNILAAKYSRILNKN
jgi:hypothetical protein